MGVGNTEGMATQSQAPSLLLTRPEAQSQRFAAEVQKRFGSMAVVISPLMAPSFLLPDLQGRRYSGLVLTSETGVEAARRISAMGQSLPELAYCVGDQTALAARQAGFDARSSRGNSADLTTLILREKPPGPLLHIRGADVRGDIAETVTKGGIETQSVIGYTQEPHPLSEQALGLLGQNTPVIVPIFSPRSGQLLVDAVQGGCESPLWIAAISPAAADIVAQLAPVRLVVATAPDANSMLQAVADLISLATSA